MPAEVVESLVGDDIALDYKPDMGWKCGPDFCFEKRIMGASQQDRIDFRVCREELFDVLFHKETRPLGSTFAVLHQRDPHRAGMLGHLKIREKMADFKNVAVRGYRPRRRKNADMPRFGKLADFFGGRTHDAEHAAVRKFNREHLLLDAAERLCRSGIACKND